MSYRIRCSAALGLSLLCCLGSNSNGASPCFTEVLVTETTFYVVLDGNDGDRKFDYDLKKDIELFSPRIRQTGEGDSKQTQLAEVLQIGVVPKGTAMHILKRPLLVRTADGAQYLLRAGTGIKYTLPEPQAEQTVTIPKNTLLIEGNGGRKEGDNVNNKDYKLADALTFEISLPQNRELTLTVDSQIVVDRIPGSNNRGTTLEINPKRAPVNAYVTLTLKNDSFDFSKARFHVCLMKQVLEEHGDAAAVTGWLDSDDIELKLVQSGKAVLRSRIPKIDEGGIFAARSVVLAVVARDPNGKVAEAISREFKVSSRGLAVFWWVTAAVVPYLIAGAMVGRREPVANPIKFQPNPIWFVSGRYGGASLSLAQILLWTVLVFSASFYVLVMSGTLLDLTNEVLVLLGITGGSSVIAMITASTKDERGRAISASEQLGQGQQPGAPRPQKPRWMDLFQTDGRPDLYKVQMALFTTLAAVFVTMKIYSSLEFPPLPAGLLTLIGISNGVYLAAKATSRTVFEKLADTAKEKQRAEDEHLNRKAEAEEAAKQLEKAKVEETAATKARNDTQANFNTEPDVDKKVALNAILEGQKVAAQAAAARVKEAEEKKKDADDAEKAEEEKLKRIKKEFDSVKAEIDKVSRNTGANG